MVRYQLTENILFRRQVCSAYGYPLEKADLHKVLEQNEPVFVKVDTSKPEEEKTAAKTKTPTKAQSDLKASAVWIGWPKKEGVDPPKLEDIPKEKRHKFLLYLGQHNLTFSVFLKCVEGDNGPERMFIPFRRDENKGTVVHLYRNHKEKGKGETEAIGGYIRVNKGPLEGKL